MCRQNSRNKCVFPPPYKLQHIFLFFRHMCDESSHSSAFSFIKNMNCCIQFVCFYFKKKITNRERVLSQAKPSTCFTSTSSYCLFSIFASYLIINSVEEKKPTLFLSSMGAFKKKMLFLLSSLQRFGKISGVNTASLIVHIILCY